MPVYSPEEAAGLLGQAIVEIRNDIAELKAAPVRARVSRSVERGRQLALQRGGEQYANEVGQHMLARGISHWEDAMALMPAPAPSDYLSDGGNQYIKELLESTNDTVPLMREVNKTLQEIRAYQDEY
jgi:hypothetical protein